MKVIWSILFFLLLSSSTEAQIIHRLDSIHPQDSFSNIKVKALSGDSLVNSFLIWIKKEVPLHQHKEHSEHVMLLEGAGILQLGDSSFELQKGDWVFIPKGTPHSFITTSKIPAKVLSIQAPYFDGKDRHPIKKD